MSARVWMYTSHTSRKDMTIEWLTKTKGFLRAAFANGQRTTCCPCAGCNNWHKRTEDEMCKHLQKRGFTPDYTVWTFHGESTQRARAEALRRRTNEHGTRCKTWCKTLMMLRTRTMRWRNLQRPSMKCWSLQNILSTSILSFVRWMPSHK